MTDESHTGHTLPEPEPAVPVEPTQQPKVEPEEEPQREPEKAVQPSEYVVWGFTMTMPALVSILMSVKALLTVGVGAFLIVMSILFPVEDTGKSAGVGVLFLFFGAIEAGLAALLIYEVARTKPRKPKSKTQEEE